MSSDQMRNSRPNKTSGYAKLYHVMWRLNQLCNYKCVYCFRDGVDEDRLKEHPDCGKYGPEKIAECFDNTQRTWRIHMTGGEPFLYPKFVELARALARNHQLSINTNLSTPNIYDFASEIPPSTVHAINATAHILELEKRGNALKKFVEKLLLLQGNGFRVRLMYITYPPLLTRLKKDLNYFESEGIKDLIIKVFRGSYEGEIYPNCYSEEQIKFIKGLGLSRYERAILAGKNDFLGRLCSTGHKAFNMDISGNLTRCCSIEKKYGNLFEQNYHFEKSSIPCSARSCICLYQGIKFAERKPLHLYIKTILKRNTRALLWRARKYLLTDCCS